MVVDGDEVYLDAEHCVLYCVLCAVSCVLCAVGCVCVMCVVLWFVLCAVCPLKGDDPHFSRTLLPSGTGCFKIQGKPEEAKGLLQGSVEIR